MVDVAFGGLVGLDGGKRGSGASSSSTGAAAAAAGSDTSSDAGTAAASAADEDEDDDEDDEDLDTSNWRNGSFPDATAARVFKGWGPPLASFVAGAALVATLGAFSALKV